MKSYFYVLRCQLKCLCLPSSYSTSVARVVNSSVPSSSNDRFMNDNRINSMREDESLVLMGDFVGVKPSSLTMANKKQKDSVIVIAKLQDEIYSNHRLKANTFVTSVLQPLERKLEPFCTTLNNSSDLYAPIVIKMCGEMMTDVPIQNRMAILNRLIKAMTKLGLKLSVDGINAMIKVWIDNQHRFDVFKLMNFVEKNLQLSLNTQFFSLCAWELARQGDLQKLASWGDEARSRCLKPEIDIELAAIFCSENNGFIQHSEHLMQSFLAKHGANEKTALRVLIVAEEICQQRGIDGVFEFLCKFRQMFVVHKQPPNSMKFRNAIQHLFVTAFRSLAYTEWKDLEPCKFVSALCDFLIDQQLIVTRESFVDAGVEYFLEQSMFSEAFCFWRTQVRVYHCKYGMQSLLNYVIGRYEEHEGVCKDRIVEIMREASQIIQPSEYIACVVSSMLLNGYLEDAKSFTKLFSISAYNFFYPLRKILEQENLGLIEDFGGLLQDVYFAELRDCNLFRKAKKLSMNENILNLNNAKSENCPANSAEDVKTAFTVSSSCNFGFLLNIWKQPFGAKRGKKFTKKPTKLRLHKVDIRHLENLAQTFLSTWIATADRLEDCSSLTRLHAFASINELQMRSHLVFRCRKVFLRNAKIEQCPFVLKRDGN